MPSPVDQIAELLVGNEPAEEQQNSEDQEPEEVSDDEEAPEDVKESEEPEESEGEPEGESEEPEQEVTWADTLKVDESKLVLDDDGNFAGVKVKIDGEESQVDLNTLIAGYQTAKSTTKKSQALAEQRKALDAEHQQYVADLKHRLQVAEQFTNALGQRMMAEFQGVNWGELRQRNPAEYAAAMADMQARGADIQNLQAQINQQLQQAAELERQQADKAQSEYIKEAAERTIGMFPEWKSPEVVKKDFTNMRNFIGKFGFTDDEFRAISDPRIFALLKSVSNEPAEALTEKQQPKPMKPPVIRPATRSRQNRSSKLDRLVKRAKTATGSRKRDAQTDAIAELLISGGK